MTRARGVTLALVGLAAAGLAAILFVPSTPGTPEPAAGAGRGRYDSTGALVEGERRFPALPNIVLVILDTVRADSIVGRDGKPPAMPTLAAWAANSTNFTGATSPASWTAPSVSSILTGLLPSQHGVSGALRANRMSDVVPTLAEFLSAIGYRTVALTGGGWVSRSQGLGQGFSDFHEPWWTEDPQHRLETTLAALPQDRKPVFLLLHTYEAHDAYGPKDPPVGQGVPAAEQEVQSAIAAVSERILAGDPLPLDEARRHFLRFSSEPLYRGRIVQKLNVEPPKNAAETYQFGDFPKDPKKAEVVATMRERYDAGLARLDGHLGPLFEMLDRAGFSQRTVTIVCSDHGEAFGEHDLLLHGHSLYDELTRVLLLVHAPRLPAGAVAGSCGLVDIAPTVLAACGMPVPEDCPGRSLFPLARGAESGAPVVAQEHRRTIDSNGKFVILRLASVRTDRAKVLLTRDPSTPTPTEALFDLVADPAERTPLPVERLERFGTPFVRLVDEQRAALRRD